MHIVYVVLRIGMILITLSLLSFGAIAFSKDIAALSSPLYLMEVTLIGVIILNAVLMTKHVMPMKFGPVLAGGSWYSLFLVTALPFAATLYPTLLIFYGAFLVLFCRVYRGEKLLLLSSRSLIFYCRKLTRVKRIVKGFLRSPYFLKCFARARRRREQGRLRP